MNILRRTVEFAALILFAGTAFGQISDTSPPSVIEFEISPTTVDVSTNDQVITLTARIADDLSGFGSAEPSPSDWSFATVSFTTRPANSIPPSIGARLLPSARAAGNEFDGVYKAELLVPAHSRTGIWMVANFSVGDEVRNVTNLTAFNLRRLGLPISFTVTGVEDSVALEMTALTLGATNVDSSAGVQRIPVSARIREDGSLGGVDPSGLPWPPTFFIQYASPSQRQVAEGDLTPVSEENGELIYDGTVGLPRFSEPGVWQLMNIQIRDRVGNVRLIDLATAITKGFTTEFTVSGAGDTEAPTLRSFKFSRQWIPAPTTNDVVMVSVRFTDDLSGVGSGFDQFGNTLPGVVFLEVQSPARQSQSVGLWPAANQTGLLDVTFSGALYFRRFCEAGIWKVTSLSVRDSVGNQRRFDAAALRELGYPGEIAVGTAPRLAIAQQGNSIVLSWPAWGESFHLRSRIGDFGTTDEERPASVGDQLVVTVPATAAVQLFFLTQ